MPISQFIRNFNRCNAEHGLNPRTQTAIRTKVANLGYSLKPNCQFFTPGSLAKILGLNHAIVYNWLKLGLKHQKNRQIWRSPIFIKIEDVKKFARQRPELFGGIPYCKLFIALEDEKLAEQISKTYPKRLRVMHQSKPVICKETGRVYKSIKHAGRVYRIWPSTIARSIRKNHSVNGFHFEFLNQ